MTKTWTTAYVLGLLALAGGASAEPAGTPSASSEIVATIGKDRSISANELDQRLGNRLLLSQTQAYEIKRKVLEEQITQTLLEAEAARAGISVAELDQREIEGKVPEVSVEEARAVLESAPDNFRSLPEAEALARLRRGMRQQRVSARRTEYLRGLELAYKVTRHLDPPRIAVSSDDDPSLGPSDAPVTIVLFSDYECPYCARASETVRKLKDKYGDRLRVVLRDLPLPMHKEAARAAEAAECADDQNKFWAMHDVLFSNQKDLSAGALPRYAEQAGLDAAAFSTCLQSGRHASEVQKDKSDAEAYGVSSTPVQFINGRLVPGNRPLAFLTQVVDEELEMAATRTTRAQ